MEAAAGRLAMRALDRRQLFSRTDTPTTSVRRWFWPKMGRACLRSSVSRCHISPANLLIRQPTQPSAERSRFFPVSFPTHSHNLGEHLRPLQSEKVPGVTGWKWIATPGHSPGHISLFRPSDRVLLAGDAFATMNMDSWSGLFTGRQTLARAASPFNTDWLATHSSVQELANLRPNVVGCGHGIPMHDVDLPGRVEAFAEKFRAPRHGRYVRRPARTDKNGIVDLPPAPFDPVPLATAASLVLAGIAIGAGYLDDEKRR